MPRPKRSKVAPSAPAPRLRNSATSTPKVSKRIPTARAPAPSASDISDPDEAVEMSVRRVRRSNGKGKAVEGARGRAISAHIASLEEQLPAGHTCHSERDRVGTETRAENASSVEIDLDSSISSIEISRRERSTPLVENSRLSLANFRRRPRQPSILGRGPGRARSSSVESNLAEDTGLMGVGRNTSTFGVANSRRQQGQASIMGQNVAPVSMGLELQVATPAHGASVLNIGNFKRRAREPSILGTGQKKRQRRPISDDEDEEDEEDDFQPEDESTPVNLSKSRHIGTSYSGAESSSNPRKRKLSAVSVPSPSQPSRSPSAVRDEEAIPSTTNDEANDSESELLPGSAPEPSIEDRSITPEPLSETMALPQSSSSSNLSPMSPVLPHPTRRQVSREPVRRRALRGRTPPPRTQDSPISSPPSLTYSPNRAVTTARAQSRKQAPPPSAFSTAQLQSLMPRRRRRTVRDPFDIPSSDGEIDTSGLASDDDELSHLAARSRRPIRAVAPLRKARGKPAPKGPQPTSKRTYGSRANPASDKENEEELDPNDSLAPLPDDDGNEQENSQELEQRVGLELKRAARKFAEVDQWELEFEEVTASSSSPKDAR